jgi:hypothetical protein
MVNVTYVTAQNRSNVISTECFQHNVMQALKLKGQNQLLPVGRMHGT